MSDAIGDVAATCTVLVASCDAYADVVPGFEFFWQKYWPDCPFEVVLLTENLPETEGMFQRVIRVGVGLNWSQCLTRALEQISTPYVMFLCNDYYLNAPVDTTQIGKRLSQAIQLNAVNLRLIPNPPTKHVFDASLGLLEYRKQTAYCISTQTGFWNREFLLGLLSKTASAWEFERRGSYLVADETRPILATMTREFPFLDVIHKGYWEAFGVAHCRAHGVDIDWKKRGLPGIGIRIKEGLKKVIFDLNPDYVTRIQNWLSRT